jgi:hypothetical protein
MKRLALTTTLAALALPATAAASQGGVVLSVNSKHHAIEVVDAHHVVHGYAYSGRLPKLHVGSRIGFTKSRGHLAQVRVLSSRSHTVAFLARVLRSNATGVAFSLGDGTQVHFSAKQVARHRTRSRGHRNHLARAANASASGISINIEGLEPGVTVLVTETVNPDGSITITITLPPSGAPGVSGEESASGDITEVDDDAFVLTTDDGSDLRLHMGADALANLDLQTCDTASVTYHQDGGMLIADTVKDNGPSSSDECADDEDQDAYGPITAISDTSVTIATDGGPMTFQVDPEDELTDGFNLGDDVDVSYYSNGDGTYSADDIEYNDQDVQGTVTDVSDGSVTFTDAGGQSHTFTADPDDADFDGISVGDQIDLFYYVNSGQPGQPIIDWVDDLSTD